MSKIDCSNIVNFFNEINRLTNNRGVEEEEGERENKKESDREP